MRLMALDVGKRRIGVAVSDPMGLIARPHSTIDRNRHAPAKIAELTREMDVKMILVGLPLHLDGSEGAQAADVRGFAGKLAPAVPGLELRFVDERLTTVEAQERLYDRRGGWRKNKDRIDAFAAAALMERYLNER
jgi:putative Holliday junction resolvase